MGVTQVVTNERDCLLRLATTESTSMATFISRGFTTPATYYRPPATTPYVPPHRPPADVRDDYERKLTTHFPTLLKTLLHSP